MKSGLLILAQSANYQVEIFGLKMAQLFFILLLCSVSLAVPGRVRWCPGANSWPVTASHCQPLKLWGDGGGPQPATSHSHIWDLQLRNNREGFQQVYCVSQSASQVPRMSL